jgi:Ca2+/Na+ antiporter
MILEIGKFIIYSGLIVLISKYILVITLRKLAENLNLKPKTVGDIAGYATSMPEFLTISISSMNGLISTSIFNILSSNIINLIQYLASIILNKNKKAFTNKAIKIDIILVLITILIPLILVWQNVEINILIIPAFIILYALFRYLNANTHKLYLEKEDKQIERKIRHEGEKEKGNTRKTVLYIIILIGAGFLLYVIGELLGDTLNNLCFQFKISQTIIGILLGFVTSIPELITFFESQKHYKEQNNNDILGVVEATNNLLTSNILNLFIIQSIGIIIYTLLY